MAEEATAFRETARSLASGLEAELTLVLDSMFPMPPVVEALVLTDRSTRTAGRDYGVLSGRTWRLADLSAKQPMLLAGLGWGNMPSHLAADDIARGRLRVIRLVEFDPMTAQLVMGGAYLADRQLGPAGRWMLDYLSSRAQSHLSDRAGEVTKDRGADRS